MPNRYEYMSIRDLIMQTKLIKTTFILLLALMLSSCMLFNRTPPPPKAKLQKFQQTLAVRPVWSQHIGNGTDKHYVKLTPTLANGRIFADSYNGTVESLSETDGRKFWQVDLREPITSGVGVGNGLVVVGTGNGGVYALNANNGAILWRSEVGGEVLAKPTVTGNRVYVKAENDSLYVLNAKTGKTVWMYKQPVPALILRGSSSAEIVGNTVVTGFATGLVASLQRSTGQVIWVQQIAEPKGAANIERMIDIDETPIISGNRVYVATYQGKLAALNARNGQILWQRDLSTYAGMTLSLGNLYVSDADSHVWAFVARSGRVLWKQDNLFGRYLTGPAVVSGALAVGDAEGYLHFLSLEDGHFIARVRVDKRGIIANPMVFGNMIYVYGNSGRLVAYRVG